MAINAANPFNYTLTQDIEITPIFGFRQYVHTYDTFVEQYIKNRGLITRVYDTYTLNIPQSGYYNVLTEVRGGQTGSGYSGDKWQYCQFHLYIDGANIVTQTYRRSQGFDWKTIYNNKIYLTAGNHTFQLQFTAKGSSKDKHWTRVYEWKNTVNITA